MPIINPALNSALELAYSQLNAFSSLENFWQTLDTAFGTQYNRSFAEILRLQWQAGDFTQLPQIEIVDNSILGNANGAYASSTNKIYLSNILIANATSATINAVLLEEIGHFIDAQINLTDSAGDEGAIFAELVQGYSLDIEILEALKAEDDHTTIAVNGQIIQVEQQNFTGTNGNDTITGTSGNDVIQGLRGNDTFYGGAGNDVFVFDFERYQNNYDVVMDFVQGQDKVDIKNLNISAWATLQTLISNDGQNNALITTYYGGYASQLKLNGINSTQLQTTDFIFNTVTANDTINGDDYNGDRLFGGLGNDTLRGFRGEDILFGEQGDDRLEGGAENDILYGGAGNDTFVFDFDRYQRYQNNNDIVIDFVRGQDKIDITKLNIADWATLQILLGNDGQNNALIKTYVDGLESKLQLNGINYAQLQSTDFIFNTVNANDVVDGNDYHGDRLFGGLGNDTLRGLKGEDALFGEQGDDRLEGGADNDILYGGAGNDTAVYSGTRSQYQLSNSNGLYTITHLISNGDGIDQLYDIEKIQFLDQTITLIDTALPVINLALSPSIVSENGSANLVYTFTRTGSTASALTVNYKVGGTATLNADYNQNGAANFTTTAGTINFAAGASSATLSLDPIPDTIVESDETIILTLFAGTGYAIANTTPVIGTISSNTNNVGFNYSEALEKSILFYEAQRSGNLNEATNRVPWRGDSALNDGADVGIDLTGGYYDAGDHVKFGFPMASSMTMLSWGAVQYRNAYQQSGQLDEIMDAIKWGTDYILKAHVTNGGVTTGFWGQVGLGDSDHAFWGPPEKMTMARPAFKIDATKPGSDLAGEAAAALASASIIFRSTNVTYADRLLQNAVQLFTFAETYKGKYSDSITDAAKFYKSNGYNDELIWAATWLYKATKAAGNANTTYLSKAENYSTNLNLGTWTQTWDDKSYGAMVLLAQESTNIRYRTEVEKWLGFWTNKNGTGVTYTPGGLAWLNQWGSLRYAANTAFVAGVYADTVNDPNKLYSTFAESQIDYILGDNPNQRSYMVGFGNNSPQNPHHRAAHGSLTNNINDPVVNRNILYGAMVGGPNQANDNSYSDDRTNYVTNEVALDYNAGLTGAIARIYGLNGQPLNTNITLALTPTSVTEDGNNNLVYTFTRTGSTTNSLTVNYSIAGTANSSDYTGATPGTGKTITFAAGSSTATLIINPTADTTVEANETVALTLATGTGYTVGTTTAVTGTITNDDVVPSITLAVSPASVIENGATNLVYTFTRTGSTTNSLTVNYSIAGTANSSDYTGATPGTGKTITFAAGSSTATLTIDPTADTTVEANETVALTLATGTGYTVGTTTAVTGTITNDDIAPSVTINLSANQTIVEGLSSPQNVTYTVTLSSTSNQTITVQYATVNGTAIAGSDYTSKTGTLTFNPGIKTQSIIIPILNNSLNEANETFTVTLTSPTNASLGTKTSATTTITDTLNASATTTLSAGVENLTLTGTANINGTGNAGNNVIRGNGGNNTLTGGGGKDTLFGGVGIDRFSYKTLTDSLLSNFDVITDFNATTGNDLFLVTNARAGFTNAGTVTTLDAAGISAKLTTANFRANFTAQFSFGTRTFVAINDATAGFSAAADAIIEVTGLTGTLGINNFVTV